MRKLIIALAVVAFTCAIDAPVEAAKARRSTVRRSFTSRIYRARRSNPVRGIFGRLMELERRKNAWLFGR